MKRTNLETTREEIMGMVKEIEWVYDQLNEKIVKLSTVDDRLISVRKLAGDTGITISSMGLTVTSDRVEFDGELVLDATRFNVNEDALRAILKIMANTLQLMEIELTASNRSLSSSIMDALS